MLEPDAEVLAEKMRWTYDHAEETRGKGESARKRAAEHWTWQKSAERALERVNALLHRPVLRHQQEVDAIVLIDVKTCRGRGTLPLKTTLDSLNRNSYARLRAVLWIDNSTSQDDLLLEQFKDLMILRNLSFRAVLQELWRSFRTALLVFVPVPLWFSKQWVAQVLEVSQKAGAGPKILAPSSNFEDSRTFVPFEGSFDEYTFQKFARTHWRNQRGVFQGINSSVPGVVAVTRECLESLPDPVCLEWQEWIAALQREGCRTYWVKDTYLLRPPSPTYPPHVVNSVD